MEEEMDMQDLLTQLAGVFGQTSASAEQEEAKEPVLPSFDAEGFVKYLQDNECKNVVVLAGAGISTSAGIPDFRTPGTGLYDNLQKYELEEPEDVFSIDFFEENPNPFYDLAKELYPGNFKPTPSHHFVRLLQDKGILLRHYTQNIDTLEREAGVVEDKVIEAHGSFATAHCVSCKQEADPGAVKATVFDDAVPRCSACGGVVKPDIVFFGEALPARFMRSFKQDLARADALIVMGTSLKVHPFASLISYVQEDTPRLLINRDCVGTNPLGFSGAHFDFEAEYRDVFLPGTCDDGVRLLSRLLGWEDDLDRLIAEGDATFVARTQQQREDTQERPGNEDEGDGAEGQSQSVEHKESAEVKGRQDASLEGDNPKPSDNVQSTAKGSSTTTATANGSTSASARRPGRVRSGRRVQESVTWTISGDVTTTTTHKDKEEVEEEEENVQGNAQAEKKEGEQ